MAERNIQTDNSRNIIPKYTADTQCGSCDDEKATGYCLDCGDFVCDECQAAHARLKATRNHQLIYYQLQYQTINHGPQTNLPYCELHPNSVSNTFCATCDELLCENCLATTHENHKHEDLEATFSKHKREIIAALKPTKEKLDEAQLMLELINKKEKEIAATSAATEAAINSEVEQIEHLLKELKAKCIGTLKQLTQQQLTDLKNQKKEVEYTCTKLSGCIKEIQKKLLTVEEVVIKKETLIKKIKQGLAIIDLDHSHLDGKADIELYVKDREKLHQACQDFLKIIKQQMASTEDSYIEEDGLRDVVTGTQKTVIFHAMTRNKQEFDGTLNLKAELVNTTDQDKVQCEVVKETNSKHRINYFPMKKGKYELHLTIDGNPIQGSPFSVLVTIGKPSKIIPNIGLPKGTAINSKSQIVLLESGGACVSVMTPEGERIRTFGTAGSRNGQLSNAFGITVDKDDYIYVADYGNYRIQKFSPDGEFVDVVGCYGKNQLQFYNPVGICYNHRDNNLYVADNNNHRVQVLSTDLKFVRSFGTKGPGSGQFANTFDVAFDRTNNVYVADIYNNCVQVLTPEGRFVRAFSQKVNSEKLVHPRAIAIDSNNIVYVVEKGPHIVSVFTTEGVYISTFGGEGSEVGQFKTIYGISVDHNDSIIVPDYNNGRLQIYK